jgi:hypothetical protein
MSNVLMVFFTGIIAAATVTYVVVTCRLLRATKESADAANKNAGALVNSQRAWIMVDANPGARVSVFHVTTNSEGESTTVRFPLVCRNEGGTPAWITEKFVRARVVESMPPLLGLESASDGDFHDISLEPLGVGKELAFVADVRCSGRVSGEKFVVLFGFVKYRDVFGHGRETRFGYEVSAEGKFTRIPAGEYNSFS